MPRKPHLDAKIPKKDFIIIFNDFMKDETFYELTKHIDEGCNMYDMIINYVRAMYRDIAKDTKPTGKDKYEFKLENRNI